MQRSDFGDVPHVNLFMTDWGPVRVSPLEAAILDYEGTRWADRHLNSQAASIKRACDRFARLKLAPLNGANYRRDFDGSELTVISKVEAD